MPKVQKYKKATFLIKLKFLLITLLPAVVLTFTLSLGNRIQHSAQGIGRIVEVLYPGQTDVVPPTEWKRYQLLSSIK